MVLIATLPLTEKGKNRYLKLLPNKIWKVLPLYEKDENYKKYLKRLLDDMNSANDLFDGLFADVIIKLNVIYIKNLEHKEIRSIVLECTNSVSNMKF